MLRWYVVRVQAGREDRIRENLIRRLKAAKLEERVTQVLVPSEKVTEMKGGKKRVTQRKLYPGYLMLEADLEDLENERTQQVRAILRETPGFGDFVGGSLNHPVAMGDEEVRKVLGQMESSEESPRLAIGFQKGDMVKIKEGPFAGFDGAVDEVNPQKGTVRIIVTIFGRPTSVELEYWQVEPV
jgi:transcriptional antiterminator NusG